MGQCVKQNKKCLCSLNALLPTTKLSLFPQQLLATREAATQKWHFGNESTQQQKSINCTFLILH